MLDLQFNLPTIAKITAILLGLTASFFGLTFLIFPLTAAQSFGLPQNKSQKRDTTFLRVVGGRNLAIRLMGLSLAYQGDFRGVGTVLLRLVIPGTLDSVIIWRKGVKSAAYGHIVGTMVFVVLGVYFVFGGSV